jgi:hypothetical protein
LPFTGFHGERYTCTVIEPRRVLISWDIHAEGIEWVSTKEELNTPLPRRFYEERIQLPSLPAIPRPWRELLSEQLIRDLKAWNDSWDLHGPEDHEVIRELQEQAKGLAIRVQNELGTDGWEVLYKKDGWVYRVHPPGNWLVQTWEQDLLGYPPPDPRKGYDEDYVPPEALDEEALMQYWLWKDQQLTDADGSASD